MVARFVLFVLSHPKIESKIPSRHLGLLKEEWCKVEALLRDDQNPVRIRSDDSGNLKDREILSPCHERSANPFKPVSSPQAHVHIPLGGGLKGGGCIHVA